MNNRTISDNYIPPVELRRFVQSLLSDEVKGNKVEAERVSGVRRNMFYYHLKNNPRFREWFYFECMENLKRDEDQVMIQLKQKIASGDLAAIKLYFELTGRVGKNINQTAIINKIENSQEVFEGQIKTLSDDELRKIIQFGDMVSKFSDGEINKILAIIRHWSQKDILQLGYLSELTDAELESLSRDIIAKGGNRQHED